MMKNLFSSFQLKATADASRFSEAMAKYGDFIYDFCHSMIDLPIEALSAFRSVQREIEKHMRSLIRYEQYERAWILKITLKKLISIQSKHRTALSPQEQLKLNASQGVQPRLEQLGNYLRRLSLEDHALLLLRDKYGLPYTEIALIFSQPPATLKLKRQQALRALEEWIWETS
jgi:DNA-directed RNA polymerase specialized sigma24 family protein